VEKRKLWSLLIPLTKKVIEKKNEPLINFKSPRSFYRIWDIYLKRGINSFKANNFIYTYLLNLEDDLDLSGMPEGSKEILFLTTRGITVERIVKSLSKNDLAKFYDVMTKSPDKFLENLESAGLIGKIGEKIENFKDVIKEYQEGDFRYLADFMVIKYPNTKEHALYCALMFINDDLIRCGKVYKDPSRLFRKLRRLKNARYEDIDKIILRFPEIYYKLIRPDYLSWLNEQKEKNLWATTVEEIRAGKIPNPVRISLISSKTISKMAELIEKSEEYIRNCPDRFYVIEKNGFFIGCASIRLRDGRIAHVRVKEEVRRCGVGTKLIKKCLKVLKEHSPQNLAFVQIEINNEISRKFFESLGFKLLDFERDDLPRFFKDPLTDEDLIKFEVRHPHFTASILSANEIQDMMMGETLEDWIRDNIDKIKKTRFNWWLNHIPRDEGNSGITILRGRWTCPDCGQRIPSYARYCFYCNTENPNRRRCENCGHSFGAWSPSCDNCGWNWTLNDYDPNAIWNCGNCGSSNVGRNRVCRNCGRGR